MSDVIQADREAAASTHARPATREAVLRGAHDDSWLVQLLAKHRIAALSGVDQWQDIATAPKDGTGFLAGRWADGHLAGKYFFRDISWWEDEKFQDVAGHPPTHWQPLPAPPQTETGKGRL